MDNSAFWKYTQSSQIRTPKMRAPPSTGQLSSDILLIKSLESGVVIGVAMTCCCVFYTLSYLRTFPTYGHPLVPRCPDKRGLSVSLLMRTVILYASLTKIASQFY